LLDLYVGFPEYAAKIVIGELLALVGVYWTMHDPATSEHVCALKLPFPVVVKLSIVPAADEGFTVIVQVDADPTVIGAGIQEIVVVLGVEPAANTGLSEVPTQNIVTDNTRNSATQPPLMRISLTDLPSQVRY
jgi:hypothetical protein